jgi:DNA-3-methyladenine glycosylase I
MDTEQKPCGWAMQSDLERQYHDSEWGVPCIDDQRLFEFLVLESAQAGLSWRTVLQKREAYRHHYAQFDASRVAGFAESDVQRMLADPGLIRNRAKIEASIANARVFLELQSRHGSFANYLWAFVDGEPVVGRWTEMSQVPVQTDVSVRLSKALKKAGMRFFGPTIAYAYMQSMGLVNDHLRSCPCFEKCTHLGAKMAASPVDD